MITIDILDEQLILADVPACRFKMGSTLEEIDTALSTFAYTKVRRSWFLKEYPAHQVSVDRFRMATTVVTNRLYSKYLAHRERAGATTSLREAILPADVRECEQAESFATWAAEVSGLPLRLPTEEEWELAARGPERLVFPWGSDFDAKKCNTKEHGLGCFLPVNALSEYRSPFGIIQMAGNIEEWTTGLYRPYPGGKAVHDRFVAEGNRRVLRGGKYDSHGDLARAARRHGITERVKAGIRLVYSC